MTAFADSLHHASWRGVPFGMLSGDQVVGRRKVRHEYPYRDTIWLEDQGRLPREFRLVGFLVGNSAVYGGGDLAGQIKRMLSAAEASGSGILVHPMRGRLTVDLTSLVVNERWQEGNYAEVQFTFVQGGTQIFPSIVGALGDLVSEAAGLADLAGLSAFSSSVFGPLQNGISAATALSATASEWTDRVQTLARDATSLYGTISQLGGADYGRYFNGRNSGFLAGLSSPYAGAASITDLINIGATARAAVASASAAIPTTIAELGEGAAPDDVGRAVQTTVAALQASAANPADGVRLLAGLATLQPLSAASRTAVGTAMSDLFRRAAGSAIARVSATYSPSSADDAHAVRGAVLAPVEAVIARAGVTGEDGIFQAYRGIRRAVVDDLNARGGALARIIEVDLPAPLPSVIIAQRLYGDAGRADELETQADPIHPWFMPVSFKALAA